MAINILSSDNMHRDPTIFCCSRLPPGLAVGLTLWSTLNLLSAASPGASKLQGNKFLSMAFSLALMLSNYNCDSCEGFVNPEPKRTKILNCLNKRKRENESIGLLKVANLEVGPQTIYKLSPLFCVLQGLANIRTLGVYS